MDSTRGSKSREKTELHKHVGKHFKKRTIILKHLNAWPIQTHTKDVMLKDVLTAEKTDVKYYFNSNQWCKCILMVIDVFSKDGRAEQVKNTRGLTITNAFRNSESWRKISQISLD